MDESLSAEVPTADISIDRCRELLGEEAVDLCGDEIDRIQRWADAVAPS